MRKRFHSGLLNALKNYKVGDRILLGAETKDGHIDLSIPHAMSTESLKLIRRMLSGAITDRKKKEAARGN